MKKGLILSLFTTLFSINFASANDILNYLSYTSPTEFLSSEIFSILIIGLVIWSVVNYSLSKTQLDKPVRIIISVSVAVLTTIAIEREIGIGYAFQQNLGQILILLVALLGISLLVHMIFPKAGFKAPLIILLVLWTINNHYDLRNFIPYQLQNRTTDEILFLFSSSTTFYILLILTLTVLFIQRLKKEDEGKYVFPIFPHEFLPKKWMSR